MKELIELFETFSGGAGLTLLTLVVVSFAALLVVLGLYDSRFLIAVSILSYSLPLVNSSLLPPLSNVYIALALGLVVLLGMTRGKMPKFELLRTGAFPATAVHLGLGILLLGFSVNTGESIGTAVSILIAAGYVWMLLSVATPEEIRSSMRAALGVVVVVSVVFVLLNPGVGISGSEIDGSMNRWRGILENPNALAALASMVFLLSNTQVGVIMTVIPTLVILFGSGSRSSTLGLGVVMWPRIFARATPFMRRASMVVAIVAALPLLYAVFFTEGSPTPDDQSGVMRVTNTRAESWGYGTDAIKANLFGGIGLGNDRAASGERMMHIHSSVLRPLTELGLPALIPLGMVLAKAIQYLRAPESSMRTIFAFLIIYGVFEGWIFAGGSLIFIVFLVSASLVDMDLRDDKAKTKRAARERLLGTVGRITSRGGAHTPASVDATL